MDLDKIMHEYKMAICGISTAALLAASMGCAPAASQPQYVLKLKRFQKADFSDSEYRSLPANHKKEIDELGYTYIKVPEQAAAPKPAEKTLEQKTANAKNSSWWSRHKKKVAIGAAIVAAAGLTYAVGEKNDWWHKDNDSHDKKSRPSPVKGGVNPNVGPDQGDGDDSSKDKDNSSGDGSNDSGDGDDGSKDSGNW